MHCYHRAVIVGISAPESTKVRLHFLQESTVAKRRHSLNSVVATNATRGPLLLLVIRTEGEKVLLYIQRLH